MVSVGYISSCSSLNFFNLINLGSSMGIPYSRGILQLWSNKCFIGMRFYINRDSVSTTSETTTVFTQPTLSVTDSTPLPKSSTESHTLLVTGDSSDQESDTTLPKSV